MTSIALFIGYAFLALLGLSVLAAVIATTYDFIRRIAPWVFAVAVMGVLWMVATQSDGVASPLIQGAVGWGLICASGWVLWKIAGRLRAKLFGVTKTIRDKRAELGYNDE